MEEESPRSSLLSVFAAYLLHAGSIAPGSLESSDPRQDSVHEKPSTWKPKPEAPKIGKMGFKCVIRLHSVMFHFFLCVCVNMTGLWVPRYGQIKF